MNKAKIIYLSDKYWWKYILFCPKKDLFFVLEKIKYLIDDGFFSVYMSASWGLMYSTINRLH